MPKTDITKPESEDLKELSDEALDEARSTQMCCFQASVSGGPV